MDGSAELPSGPRPAVGRRHLGSEAWERSRARAAKSPGSMQRSVWIGIAGLAAALPTATLR